MPDKCDRCDGDGKAHGADRPFEWTPEVGYPGPCPVCKGTGRKPTTGAEAELPVALPWKAEPPWHDDEDPSDFLNWCYWMSKNGAAHIANSRESQDVYALFLKAREAPSQPQDDRAAVEAMALVRRMAQRGDGLSSAEWVEEACYWKREAQRITARANATAGNGGGE